MNLLKTKLKHWSILLLLAFYNGITYGQCAMCKSTVESDMENGNNMAKSLNTGILYLMMIPYLVLGLGAYFFFKKQVDAKVKTWRDRYFPAKNTHVK